MSTFFVPEELEQSPFESFWQPSMNIFDSKPGKTSKVRKIIYYILLSSCKLILLHIKMCITKIKTLLFHFYSIVEGLELLIAFHIMENHGKFSVFR